LEQTAAEIPGSLALPADATKPEEIRRVVDALVKTWGMLHILVNNVGGGGGRVATSVEETPEETWHQVYARNALAAVRFTMLAIPHMRKQKWGRVVTIVSVQGREGGGRPWYNMAKSAEISLMKTLAMDHGLSRDGITFNSIAPGRVMFDNNEWDQFRREAPERFEQSVRQQVPVERIGTPEEIAAAVAFVCSAKASFLTGASLAVDGGESRSF
jgi:3-oxoacyl-[acyl-carrier protein] reductase